MAYRCRTGGLTHRFENLVHLLGCATPLRSGDELAGCAATSAQERAAAQWTLAEVPLATFLTEYVVDPEADDVTRLILQTHDRTAFAPLSSFTVGDLRDWLLARASEPDGGRVIEAASPGLTPEMVAAVSKLMSIPDMLAVSAAITVVTGFRTTLGLPGTLATRLQPNDPTDDAAGVATSLLDGLLLGCGDAVVGINPASDNPRTVRRLLELLDRVRQQAAIPMQSCVLTHVSTTIDLIEQGAPVDLVFQSIAGTQAANKGFGVTLDMLREAWEAAGSLGRGTCGSNVMYFETGQGSALSSGSHLGAGGRPVDQQTLEARAYGLARVFQPLLVNTVVGFIGPEYLYDGRQIIRAGVEDNFCGKLLGLPMGVDVCYTNHAEADADDMGVLLELLVAGRTNFVITVPGGDDIMLGYQSLSFHDALATRRLHGLRPAPEFDAWLQSAGLSDDRGHVRGVPPVDSALRRLALEQAS